MKEGKPSIEQFESEHGKIVTLLKLGKIVIKTEMCDIVPGEFPITEWRSIPFEIPLSGFKNIVLPVYTGEEVCDAGLFENFPTDLEKVREISEVPVVSVATKTCGQYSDGRLIQSICVLPIWNDKVSMVLEVQWSKSDPAKGSIYPDWYIRASPRLPVKEGLQKLKCSRLPPLAEKCSHYLYVNPSSLGTHVLGEGPEYSNKIWRREWKFDDHEKLLNAIDRLAEVVAQLSG